MSDKVFADRFKIEKGTGATEKDIEAAFSKIDKDKSGSITKQVAAACHHNQQNSTLVLSGRGCCLIYQIYLVNNKLLYFLV